MEKFVTKIALIIFEVNQKDFGTYKCVAKHLKITFNKLKRGWT